MENVVLNKAPTVDFDKGELIRIDELATGGGNDPLTQSEPATGEVIGHCKAAEYVPELVPGGLRQDLKPLGVVQPQGPSFAVTDESLVEWQKWRFRVSFNPREGAVIHDVWYDGRSILYRLAVSEMVGDSDKPPILHMMVLTCQTNRLCHMPIHDRHSSASKRLISVTEGLGML